LPLLLEVTLPSVALHDTDSSALSPVAVKPTATKSYVWLGCRVTFLGATTSWVMVDPVSVVRTGSSHPTITAATTVAAMAVRCFSRASRCASLYVNVMARLSEGKKDRAA